MLSPLGPIGRLSTPSAARSPSAPPCVPTVGDGQPDGSSRDRAAPCRTDARSAVTASAAVLGRRRATRCAAHLQNLTASTQDSCSAARARLAVATNRLSHRERRLESAGTSNWQEELKDGGGAQPAAAANQGRVFSTTRSSFGAGVGRPHAPSSSPCGARMAALMRWTADENTCPWCRSPSCQLILDPPVQLYVCADYPLSVCVCVCACVCACVCVCL